MGTVPRPWLELIIEVSPIDKSICLEISQYTGVKETIQTPEDMGNWMIYVRSGMIWDEAKDMKLVSRENFRLHPQNDYMCGLATEWLINDVMSKYFEEVPPMSSIAFVVHCIPSCRQDQSGLVLGFRSHTRLL